MNEITCYDLSGAPLDTLYQWDTNQYVVVRGAQVPPYPVFHFANRRSSEALVVAPEETGGSDLTVKIPNILLQQPETIIGYLFYETDDDAYRTKNAIRIPVVPRQMPADYMYTDNIGYPSVTAISARLSEIIHIMSEGYSGEIAPEVTDIRIGSDGTVYQTAGDAVREQIIDLSEQTRAGLSMKSDRNELAATNAEVDAIARRVGENKSDTDTKIADLATDIGAIDDKIGRVVNEVASNFIISDTMQSDLTDLSAVTENLIQRADEDEERLKLAEDEIDTINDQIGRVVNEVASSVILADATRSDLADLSATTDDLVQRVDDGEERLRLAESSIESLDDRMNSKAEQIDLAALFIESYAANAKLNEHRDRLERAEERLSSKAEVNDVAAVQAEVDLQGGDLERLRAEVSRKADGSELDELREMTTMKADANALANIAATKADSDDVDKLREMVIRKADDYALAGVNVDVDVIRTRLIKDESDISAIQSTIADVRSDVAAKVARPAVSPNGVAGQVLATNGDGTTTWTDAAAPTEEQVGEAVSEWLEAHPDATTTVADGSITEAKLSGSVIEKLENNSLAMDAAVLAGAIAAAPRPQYPAHLEWEAQLYEAQKAQLDKYSAYFTGGDGIGMLFFTDAHNFAPEAFWKHQNDLVYMYEYMRVIFENTPALYIVCGGDMMNCHDFTYEQAIAHGNRINNYLKTHVSERLYLAIGNHDLQWWGSDGRTMSNRDKARVWYDSDVAYYTVKSRICTCYMFDSGMFVRNRTEYGAEQVKWFAQQMLTEDKPHSYGVVHYIARPSDQGPDWLGDTITKIADAYNRRASITVEGTTYNYGSATGTFHFILAGHYHYAVVETYNNIPTIYSYAFVLDGTIDACYADFDNAMLHTVRFKLVSDGTGGRDIPIIPNGGYQAN